MSPPCCSKLLVPAPAARRPEQAERQPSERGWERGVGDEREGWDRGRRRRGTHDASLSKATVQGLELLTFQTGSMRQKADLFAKDLI